ncbi:AAA family ATPase [Alicyclobacillus dauci]|uniref:AAA family ATPase n=1 Tax=Alicyclobacillus dauci TaxID=1475485 RepID=A0ABY6YX81_9BACL|nr:AAA family ATPase [Alicyclobacillus dauci]WAH35202.1 AAA family ATPase [Alicyclobacillus dauci]
MKEIQFTDWPQDSIRYPFNLPVFQGLPNIRFERPVTFFVGENGSGKSTLLEAIAKCAGFNAEGGSRYNVFSTANTESSLDDHIRLSWLPKVTRGFFLRAESFFNFASYIDTLERECPTGYTAYGGKSLHQQSHGESFLSLFTHRFRGRGKALYLLDEPEAALSPARQLALLRVIWEHEQSGQAQFIIATHSPILLGYPNGQIFNFDTSPLSHIRYEETEHYFITKQFLLNRQGMLRELFESEE